jgi:hypothetical protein
MFAIHGRRLAAMAAVLSMTGCAGGALGGLGDILEGVLGQPGPGGQGQGQVEVEVQGLNTQQQLIQVRTRDGQTGGVRYDQNTVVVYRQQQYPVTALERGDIAVMTVHEVQGGVYVSRIDVTQSVQERTGTGAAPGNLVQLGGRITQIEHSLGTFVMQTQQGSVIVSLPYNASQAMINYYNQLRVGHDVRVEASMVSTGRAELFRFL